MSHPATTSAHRALDIVLASSSEDRNTLREYLCTVSNLTILPTQSPRAMEAYRTLLGIKEPTPLQNLVRYVMACAVKDVGAFDAVLPERLKRAEEVIAVLTPVPEVMPVEEYQSINRKARYQAEHTPATVVPLIDITETRRYQQSLANQIACRNYLAEHPNDKGAQLGLADNVLDEVMLRMEVAGTLPKEPLKNEVQTIQTQTSQQPNVVRTSSESIIGRTDMGRELIRSSLAGETTEMQGKCEGWAERQGVCGQLDDGTFAIQKSSGTDDRSTERTIRTVQTEGQTPDEQRTADSKQPTTEVKPKRKRKSKSESKEPVHEQALPQTVTETQTVTEAEEVSETISELPLSAREMLPLQPMDYKHFLHSKQLSFKPAGFSIDTSQLNPSMFDWQKDVTKWGLQRGKAAFYQDCGLGKTIQSLEWARHVYENTSKPVLIFAPLAVSRQTKREGEKFNIPVTICRTQLDVQQGINIANYEMRQNFDASKFSGLVLDEAGILKGDGPMRRDITEFGSHIPYRLAATATPAPNDYVELGNQAEFLGIMSKSEMLSTFFVHDGEDTQKWRLKGHAEKAFWAWLASWAVMIRKPSDLGYEDGDFKLPPIEYHQHTVPAVWHSDNLFPVEARSMRERQQARKDSIEPRVKMAAELVNASPRGEQWIVWTNLNDESEMCSDLIMRAVEVTGSQKDADKERALFDFAEGRIDRMVTKGKIAGHGLNLQRCSHMVLVGLSDSWELLYQIVRRCWRFGQKNTVHVHIITAETEGAVVRNIERKEAQAAKMAEEMLGHMREINKAEIRGATRETEMYRAGKEIQVPSWLSK